MRELPLAAPVVGEAADHIGLGIVGRELDGAVEVGEGAAIVAELAVGIAARDQGIDIVRLQHQHLVEILDGAIVGALARSPAARRGPGKRASCWGRRGSRRCSRRGRDRSRRSHAARWRGGRGSARRDSWDRWRRHSASAPPSNPRRPAPCRPAAVRAMPRVSRARAISAGLSWRVRSAFEQAAARTSASFDRGPGAAHALVVELGHRGAGRREGRGRGARSGRLPLAAPWVAEERW